MRALHLLLTFSVCSIFGQSLKWELGIDTNWYDNEKNLTMVGGVKKMFFETRLANPIVLIRCSSNHDPHSTLDFEYISLLPNVDFEVLDTFLLVDGKHQARIQFKDLLLSDFLSLQVEYKKKNQARKRESIELQPLLTTNLSVKLESEEAFVGEEKAFELNSLFKQNIFAEEKWFVTDFYDYMVNERNGKYFLNIIPTKTGKAKLQPVIKTLKPRMENSKLVYEAVFKPFNLNFKEARLPFIGINLKDITFDETSRTKGVEVLVDHHTDLLMHKTYRIEKQEEPGGHLIAELYTRNKLSNGKVVGVLRTYNLHKTQLGNLYVKDGDQLKFLSNFNITPPTQIYDIFIKRPGGDWEKSNIVYPGETVEVKFTGESLNKSNIFLKDVIFQPKDTTLRDEANTYYVVSVPQNISTRNIEIYNFSQLTNKTLRVREYLEPRNFDFISIDYGKGEMIASELNKPILYDHVIKDINIKFNPKKIDKGGKLYGEQYIVIRYKVTTLNNQLVDQGEISGLVICPDESSPRGIYYDRRKCNMPEINLNNYLRTKTYDMRDWSRLEIEIEHQKDQYLTRPQKQRIEIILQKHTEFDIDVSFPAGLLIQKANTNNFGTFGGISMAAIAQLSFFHPEKIARYRPYKLGIGFLAINAFNFNNSPDITRDVGAVALLSLFPLGSRGKLTFPMYMGGGYFLSEKQWFTLLGPGIRVSF